jgi:hypothetical protein
METPAWRRRLSPEGDRGKGGMGGAPDAPGGYGKLFLATAPKITFCTFMARSTAGLHPCSAWSHPRCSVGRSPGRRTEH